MLFNRPLRGQEAVQKPSLGHALRLFHDSLINWIMAGFFLPLLRFNIVTNLPVECVWVL